MTAIFYPDCKAASPNGTFTLEACSPINGTIKHRDGRPPSSSLRRFGHQDGFRYRVTDNTRRPLIARLLGRRTGSVLWERWQRRGEDSPHELLVSDDGWCIIRTHGFRPEVIAVTPLGQDAIRVKIGADFEPEEFPGPNSVRICSWTPEDLTHSTAGLYWAGHSWRYFFRLEDRPFFVWRTWRGQRLVLDLESRAVLNGERLRVRLPSLMEAEKQSVATLLSSFASKMGDIRAEFRRCKERAEAREKREGQGDEGESGQEPDPRVPYLTSAFHLAAVHGMTELLPYLRDWEDIDWPSMSTGSVALNDYPHLEFQALRPILHHALKVLGQVPRGYPTYHFRDNDDRRFPMPEHTEDRRTRAKRVRDETPAECVLELLGSPDYIKFGSRRVGELYRGLEDWEYDFHGEGEWTTLRISWEEQQDVSRIRRIESVPPYWLNSDARVSEILRF
jgi:hypothetical protein